MHGRRLFPDRHVGTVEELEGLTPTQRGKRLAQLDPHSGLDKSARRVASLIRTILQTLRAPESQARLERIVAQEQQPGGGGAAGVRGVRVCGCARVGPTRGCLKALTLHKAGRIALPASRRVGGAPTPQRDAPVAAATAPGTVEAVAGLSLERVEQGRQRRVWNTLLHFDQGTTTVCGLPGALSGGLGARGARRGRVFGVGVAFGRARRGWDGASASVAVPEPVPDPPRGAMRGQPGLGQVREPAGEAQATGIVRGWWRPSSATGPASRRPTSVWVGHTPVAGARTAIQVGIMYELEPHWRRRLGVARVDAAPALAPADGLDLDGERVWRGTISGCPRLVKSAGFCPERRPPTRPTTGGGEGLLRPAGVVGGHAREHSRAPPGAHAAADARPRHGAVHPAGRI